MTHAEQFHALAKQEQTPERIAEIDAILEGMTQALENAAFVLRDGTAVWYGPWAEWTERAHPERITITRGRGQLRAPE